MKRAMGSFEVSLQPLSNAEVSGGRDARAACCSPRNSAATLRASARGQMLSAARPPSRVRRPTWPSIRSPASSTGARAVSCCSTRAAMNRGVPTLSIMVVPDSGTGELAGSRGTLEHQHHRWQTFLRFPLFHSRAGRLKALADTGASPCQQPTKATGGVARPPVGMARAQPRRAWKPFPPGFPRSMPGSRRRLAASWPRRNPHAATRRRRALSTAARARGLVARDRRRAGAPGCRRRTSLCAGAGGAWRGARSHARRRARICRLWAHEQALRSGACEMALAWLPRASPRAIRRLQLAAEQGRALGVLFRSQRFAQLASPAMLRVMLEP